MVTAGHRISSRLNIWHQWIYFREKLCGGAKHVVTKSTFSFEVPDSACSAAQSRIGTLCNHSLETTHAWALSDPFYAKLVP
jgi:hypothetical protein